MFLMQTQQAVLYRIEKDSDTSKKQIEKIVEGQGNAYINIKQCENDFRYGWWKKNIS